MIIYAILKWALRGTRLHNFLFIRKRTSIKPAEEYLRALSSEVFAHSEPADLEELLAMLHPSIFRIAEPAVIKTIAFCIYSTCGTFQRFPYFARASPLPFNENLHSSVSQQYKGYSFFSKTGRIPVKVSLSWMVLDEELAMQSCSEDDLDKETPRHPAPASSVFGSSLGAYFPGGACIEGIKDSFREWKNVSYPSWWEGITGNSGKNEMADGGVLLGQKGRWGVGRKAHGRKTRKRRDWSIYSFEVTLPREVSLLSFADPKDFEVFGKKFVLALLRKDDPSYAVAVMSRELQVQYENFSLLVKIVQEKLDAIGGLRRPLRPMVKCVERGVSLEKKAIELGFSAAANKGEMMIRVSVVIVGVEAMVSEFELEGVEEGASESIKEEGGLEKVSANTA